MRSENWYGVRVRFAFAIIESSILENVQSIMKSSISLIPKEPTKSQLTILGRKINEKRHLM